MGGEGGKGENDIIIVQITSILSLLLTDSMQRTLCPSRNLGVWQIVSNKKFVNDKLVSGKLSKVLLNERNKYTLWPSHSEAKYSRPRKNTHANI